ncbi:DNA-processing protein DprA [Candidatus Methylopumilus turicensis]|uniref:Protein smf n=1 Tax=Candidatus Methylopumilus turicensis TaxID=1581680 RepID=A0A0B7IS78_9PROT|nr:DNA-processing protein DprA [Candidatus Methylopumilus turicensis]CEN55159.1 Protein smf [Candidatus Methylopumilus turicensis]
MTIQENKENSLWICLQNIHGLGGQGICKLLQQFGSPENIFNASHQALQQVVSEDVASSIKQGTNLDEAASVLAWLEKENNHLITLAETHYPQALLEIPDPPPVLYAKGDLSCLTMPTIAMVGSRNASVQGEKNAEDFAYALSEQGFCIVSGMALGIDGAAHRGALKNKQGRTIAVVGTGLDIVYPAKHRELAHKIVGQGLIISEFPIGTPSRPQNFPRRNRIISGLSLGCLVVEANTQSGSLITAKFAADQGREVFAIPGSIHSPMSKGCHELIKQGAKLVDCIQDITNELAPHLAHLISPASEKPESSEYTALLDLMGFDPINMEALIALTNLTSEGLSATLLVLELENKIASLPGGRYQRIG